MRPSGGLQRRAGQPLDERRRGRADVGAAVVLDAEQRLGLGRVEVIERAAGHLRAVAAQRGQLARGEPAAAEDQRRRLRGSAERVRLVDAEEIAARAGGQAGTRRRRARRASGRAASST